MKYNDRKAYVSDKYIKKRERLSWGDYGFLILLILVLLVGGDGKVVGAAAMLKKGGTPDMRYKVNRRK